MMGLGDGSDFLRNPPPSPVNRTPGNAERGLPREAEAMAAAGAAPTADTAADVQTAASYSITTNPSHSFYVFGEERNIDPQCNVEWPADWFIEEPRAIHQDWSMNSKFDLNMDCNIQQEIDVDDSFQMDDILGGDIEYESHSSDGSGSDFEDDLEWQQDGYTNVAELFPVPEEELDEAPATAVDKATMVREARSKAAKAKASKTREMKLRAAAGTIDDTFVLSDSCSDDNKEIINPSDDDGVVLESEIATRKHKSRAKPLKERVYYDEMKENAHEQFQLELCFHNVTQLRKALDDYHIAYRRNFTYLKNNQDRVVVCCSSEGTCSFMIYSSEIEGESTHCIRQILLPHTCGTTTDTSRIKSTWIAKKYEDMVRSDPTMNITALIDVVMREHGVEISKHMAYRAKNKALEAIEGHEDMQYLRIRDYLQTTVRRLPDAAPPPASQHHAAPPTAPRHHAAPPSAPRRNAPSNSSHESSVTGRMPNANGSRLGVQRYEGTRLYSYFTAGLQSQQRQENSQQK
ncbi:hypothetical protein D1007_58784 [Hordeum vulgare]|nr:hypothetical protein D1007_58784 [Hordeum vulgare]